MALTNFLQINLPYGIQKTSDNKWFVINREYKPLGWDTNEIVDYDKLPIATRYPKLDEKLISKLGEDVNIQKKDGEIFRILLYNDETRPTKNASTWDNYISKIEILSNLETSEYGKK